MEFYQNVLYSVLLRRRFNSQRDGILHRPELSNYYTFEFQFPTGWNSTCCSRLLSFSLSVSIPNGMEFYSYQIFYGTRFGGVSIPNGMEFYSFAELYLPAQRAFQFPTGWNSTLTFQTLAFADSLFQFPTGWNSTARIFPFS